MNKIPTITAMLLLMLIQIASSAFGQEIDSGTVIVVGLNEDRITIAADSRVTHKVAGTTDDTQCKIFALNDKFVFANAGLASFVRPFEPRWLAVHEASEALQSVIVSPRPNPNNLTFGEQVGDLWGDRVSSILANNMDILKDAIPEGLFVAVTQRKLSISHTVVVFNSTENGMSWRQERIHLDEKTKFLPFGKKDVVFEMNSNKSNRAQTENAQLDRELRHKTPSDADISKAIRLIELTIKWHPNEDVAGPIDVLQISPGARVHWVHRKNNCPEYYTGK